MFLLVPAHRGFPGQIPQSRKTVVCVCEVAAALKKMKKHKAPGLTGLVAEMIQTTGYWNSVDIGLM